jgi:hypothetical protein
MSGVKLMYECRAIAGDSEIAVISAARCEHATL